MATSFLHHVAENIIQKFGNNLSHIAVVFPNKRASLFLNEEVARMVDSPIWSPNYITISDLFCKHSTLKIADSIKLVCDLHKVFVSCTQSIETLDQFYSWGQILLNDFDDIDKNMASAQTLFTNLKDIHRLDDSSYLNEEQIQTLKKFFSNFPADHQSLLKQRFENLWNHLDTIYNQFRDTLRSQGLAYEGQLYREVAEDNNIVFQYDYYLFVGFNMMQKVELQLCDRLKKEGKAFFYWDFDNSYISHQNEAGYYIAQHLMRYPNELDTISAEIYNNMSSPKDFSFIASPTENMQARYVGQWLRDSNRIKAGKKSAIVLCNENLLPTIIHSIPAEAEQINITTGYPLQLTPIASLIRLLVVLQLQGYRRDTQKFRTHWIEKVLRHPHARLITSYTRELLDHIHQKRQFYFSTDELSITEDLKHLFTFHDNIGEITTWLVQILKQIGINYARDSKEGVEETSPFFQESIFKTYTLVNRLFGLVINGDLDVDLTTFQKLLNQLIQTTTIPFHGEPAVGIQVMGVLETRNLDFDHLLILSCNEGNMPKGIHDTSFIPYSIKKAFNLTTIDNKVSIYAYYFNRLLQRAKDITITYNNSTTDGQTGEMSRFMLQLLVESPHNIKRYIMNSDKAPSPGIAKQISKEGEAYDILTNIERLSPTAINTYIRCQLRFYYRYIAGIAEPDNADDEGVDNRVFGNIFHKAAELFYQPFLEQQRLVTKSDLEQVIQGKDRLKLEYYIDEAFRTELFKTSNQVKLEYSGLQFINREVLLTYLRQLLKLDVKHTPFRILGLEKKVETSIELNTERGKKNLVLYGSIDRLDRIEAINQESSIRVIDYKTGSNDKMSVKDVESIFAGTNLKNHTDYFLQAMLYAIIVRNDNKENPSNLPVSPSLLFIQHAIKEDFESTLKINGNRISDIQDYSHIYRELLKQKLEELFNSHIPFSPTSDNNRCINCPYLKICKC
ncbi:hypothetical protein HMPREF3034_01382 [Prevotella sp. DNF00663]|uniref:PD-(D/E)XK nuclease family protein n=1 Tax=unclassified Prevotella TaxID=2638335 RepID=UPI0005145386|nr:MULTISPECIES: PD-(D/E)XK nuclease family protein [unclassified Prevotella]KGI59814.1 nuclease [Prevotella sp. S7 MS 2]KXB83139.1 hypothetical protein HMPREF3034_01382 [Prevotella sp. DNF00663]